MTEFYVAALATLGVVGFLCHASYRIGWMKGHVAGARQALEDATKAVKATTAANG